MKKPVIVAAGVVAITLVSACSSSKRGTGRAQLADLLAHREHQAT